MCVSGLIFPNSNESAKKTHASVLQLLDLKKLFFIKQPLSEDTEFEWQPYWCTGWPFRLLSQAPERISIHVTLLSTALCFCTGFAIVFGQGLA